MRIRVDGQTASARRLRALIERDPGASLTLAARVWDFRVALSEGSHLCPVIDGIDGELERRVLAHIGQLTPAGQVLVQFAAGVIQTENEIAVSVPVGNEEEAHAVEHGIYRALLDAAKRPASAHPRWRRFLFGGVK